MKKIVALVLSLVMVLGLATTAFAASYPTITWTALEGRYDMMDVNDADGVADVTNKVWYVSNAKAPKDTSSPKDGLVDEYGWIKGFTSEGVTYVQVPSLAAADVVVYYTGTTSVMGYFVNVGTANALYYLGTPAAFTNFGDECGQLDMDPEDDVNYYIFEGVVYAETTWTANDATEVLMVANELTPVKEVADASDFVKHAPTFTYDEDYEVVAVKCAECGVAAAMYANFASVPKADKAAFNYYSVNGDEFYCWTAAKAPAADAGEKVESAETFDAGIAMYVGMSVMAAAGSAVVLKKKD